MKTTIAPDGTRVFHAIHADKEGELHWHLAAREGADGSVWWHPHWARVVGLIFPGWRPKTFKVYRRQLVELWAWQFRKRDGWAWRRAAVKTASGWARASIA